METRVQACGKLLLLQKMLKEIKNRRLRESNTDGKQ
jgi:hypothetical protein